MLRHNSLNTLGNAQIWQFFFQERSYRNFVGGIHSARQGAAHPARMVSQGKATERFRIGRGKVKGTQHAEIERLDRSVPSFGIAKRELNGDPHIGSAKVRFHASVGEFDHGMNGALRLNHNLYAVIRHLEQMMRLDYLKAFIHKGGRID